VSGNAHIYFVSLSLFVINIGNESDTGKEESTSMGMNPNLDSDLAALLNSWYAAGFYTCR
jgi:hypothetical protein